MKRLLMAAIVAVGIAGCAGIAELESADKREVAIAKIQSEVELQPDVKASCKNCGDFSLEFYHADNKIVFTRQKVNGTNDVVMDLGGKSLSAAKTVLGDISNAAMVVGIANAAGGHNKTTENSTINTIVGDDNEQKSDMKMSEDANQDNDYASDYNSENTATSEATTNVSSFNEESVDLDIDSNDDNSVTEISDAGE